MKVTWTESPTLQALRDPISHQKFLERLAAIPEPDHRTPSGIDMARALQRAPQECVTVRPRAVPKQ